MTNDLTVCAALELYDKAASLLIKTLNETTDAVKTAFKDWRNAPECLLEDMKKRLFIISALVARNYDDKSDALSRALDSLFEAAETVSFDDSSILFNIGESVQYTGLTREELEKALEAGELTKREYWKENIPAFSVKDLDDYMARRRSLEGVKNGAGS